jgi:fructokinase
VTFRTISIGELLWDLLPEKQVLGGAPANLAFRLVELQQECYLVSKVGRDELGDKACEILENLGLSRKFIQRDDRMPTGTVIVKFDPQRNPGYYITPGVAYDNITLTEDITSLARECHCIAFGTLAQRTNRSKEAILGLVNAAPQATKFLDLNLRIDCYSKESIHNSFLLSNILKANHHEIQHINRIFELKKTTVPEICRELTKRYSIKTILVTLEENGAYVYDCEEGDYFSPGYSVKLKDPLGAGDAFSAGFLYKYFSEKRLKEAVDYGNLLGAVVATKSGATERISYAEITLTASESQRVINADFLSNIGINNHT